MEINEPYEKVVEKLKNSGYSVGITDDEIGNIIGEPHPGCTAVFYMDRGRVEAKKTGTVSDILNNRPQKLAVIDRDKGKAALMNLES